MIQPGWRVISIFHCVEPADRLASVIGTYEHHKHISPANNQVLLPHFLPNLIVTDLELAVTVCSQFLAVFTFALSNFSCRNHIQWTCFCTFGKGLYLSLRLPCLTPLQALFTVHPLTQKIDTWLYSHFSHTNGNMLSPHPRYHKCFHASWIGILTLYQPEDMLEATHKSAQSFWGPVFKFQNLH